MDKRCPEYLLGDEHVFWVFCLQMTITVNIALVRRYCLLYHGLRLGLLRDDRVTGYVVRLERLLIAFFSSLLKFDV